ncbi:hypothetical protein BD779DRAFT_1745129 [Infundibulicybe gibba]|nr:hypothetical protein BD779DRAFT_1745129 [Infundibulicybe gibba]
MPLIPDKAIPWPAVLPFDKQSVAVPGTKRPGQTAIFGLVGLDTPNVLKTVDEIFETALRVGKSNPFLGHRPVLSTSPLKFAPHYVWESYGAIDLRRRYVGSAIHAMFRNEWQIIDIALSSYDKVSVSLYDTLGRDSVGIINHAHLTVIFSTSDHIPLLLKLAPKVPMLKLIVCIDDLSSESKKIIGEWSQTVNVQVKELRDIEAFGKAHPIDPIPATSAKLASICYTSVSALLTHGSLALATQSNLYGLALPEESSLLSYLPLAHIYERICELCVIAVGGKIGYFTGDPLRLLEDAQTLKPDFFPSVPRVLNRIYQAAMQAGNAPGLKGAIFKKAVEVKLKKLKTTGDPTHIFWDRLVFRKIQAVLGGQLKLVTNGSAPISRDVMDFLKIAFACEGALSSWPFLFSNSFINNRYGMTETCATCTKTWPNDPTASGCVGPPQPVNEIKLIDVPAMGYSSEDSPNPRGELCVRGMNCFASYYKDEKNTKEAIDEEGWLHTGDIAELDSCGRLKIIDRIKNIMKLAQGEYVALEKIENLYTSAPIVGQIYVHGDSLQAFLLAVVIPDPIQLASIASKVYGKPVSPDNLGVLAEACNDEKINAHVLDSLTREGQKNGLKGFEMVKRIHLSLDPFTMDDGTLTPTMKLRRKDAYNKFKTELDALYRQGEPSSKL